VAGDFGEQLVVAVVWAAGAVGQEVVVAVQWAAGAEARAVGVAGLAAVATLGVAVAVAEAGVHLGLELRSLPPGTLYMALGTRCHQSTQNFLLVVYSTFCHRCLFSFCFSFFFALLSNCFHY